MSRQSGRSFLDTDIFVYTFDASAPAKRAKARALVAAALEERSSIISYQVVQEFLSVATRKFFHPLSASEAQTYLLRVLMPLCEIYPDASLYTNALSTSAAAGITFYDALIVSSALIGGCTTLLSEDLQHGRRFGVLEIKNPFL